LPGKENQKLRRKAEKKAILEEDSPENLSETDLRKLIHELRVHQIELEMQNDELRKIQIELQIAHDQYQELFDEAPVGYLIMDTTGNILNANQRVTGILAAEKKEIIGHSFYEFISRDDKDSFYLYLKKLQKLGKTDGIELRLKHNNDTIFAFLDSSLTRDENKNSSVRLSLLDITLRKQAELELQESREKLRNLSAHILSVKELEAKRIARILHDEIGQNLFGLQMQVAALDKKVSSLDEETGQKLKQVLKYIEQIISTAQKVTLELRPPALDVLGLKETIQTYMKEFKNLFKINFHTKFAIENVNLDIEKSTTLFRILQEVLLNVHRHAQATKVDISLIKNNNDIQLIISDNGKGITLPQIEGNQSFGIIGMRERVNILKGHIDIKGAPNRGTTVKVTIPLETEHN
jgi:PAS domain S-box-containing protein